jgi:hypothetical protein
LGLDHDGPPNWKTSTKKTSTTISTTTSKRNRTSLTTRV